MPKQNGIFDLPSLIMKPYNHTNEKELLLKLRDGDGKAFEQLYNYYKFILGKNLVRLLRDEELARDALQELFIKIWNAREGIDPEKSFRAYLFRIAQHLVVDYYRKAANDKQMQAQMLLDFDNKYSHIEEHVISKDNLAIVNHIIERLPAERRAVFLLYKMEEKSYKEIADILNLTPTIISKHIYHSNQFIKKYIRQHPDLLLSVLLFALT